MSSGINNVKLRSNYIHFTKRLILIAALILCCWPASEGQNPKKWIIVVDAGHGGKDPGALGSVAREKDITLAIALKTGEYIEKNIPNVKVIYTRKTDTFVELRDRPNIANKNKADLFISIHANWAKSKNVAGTETYIMGIAKDQQNLEVAMKENEVIYLEDDFSTKYEGFDPKSEVSYIMFTVRQKEFQSQSTLLASMIQTQFREAAERRDRDVKQAGFWVLYTTTMPSVLVETGFITNPAEEKFLLSKQGQDYLASAIYRACRQYINDIDKRSIITVKYEDKSTLPKADSTPSITTSGSINFKVQIGSSSIKKDLTPENFQGLKDVSEINSDNRYRYVSGSFTDYQSAMEYRKIIQAKYPDAFVIAIKDNKLLPLPEALEETKK
jgi:N-acetylmuramoyl-L-alanine amidase